MQSYKQFRLRIDIPKDTNYIELTGYNLNVTRPSFVRGVTFLYKAKKLIRDYELVLVIKRVPDYVAVRYFNISSRKHNVIPEQTGTQLAYEAK